MAEFVEVFRAAKRMCKRYDCAMCPLSENGFECMIKPGDEIEPDEVERIVMDWAKEYPEPQYPTWEEWLVKNGILHYNYVGGTGKYIYTMEDAGRAQIPADIAEKLGIEPKE